MYKELQKQLMGFTFDPKNKELIDSDGKNLNEQKN